MTPTHGVTATLRTVQLMPSQPGGSHIKRLIYYGNIISHSNSSMLTNEKRNSIVVVVQPHWL